ncbi:MAG: N-acetylmuramoyl-L-alanine amidase [Phycisphaerae bacterium]|nr:N-acetylmuramoyl-L-alanine amidase [Phycisphaerae bacterium]
MTVGLGGCNLFAPKSSNAPEVAVGPAGTIAVSEMGGRLGLTVQQNSAHSATMGNRFNSVVFFADPGGLAYVNGREVGEKGGLVVVGEMMYVPESLEQEIRRALQTRARVVSPPKRSPPAKRSPPLAWTSQLKYGPVVIDAGHGGRDPGASYYGYREKDIVLDVALMVSEILRASGIDARMTRGTDTFIELNDRAALAREVGAKLFVSLHCDAAPNRRARGFTIYAPRDRMRQASSFAAAMERSMLTTNMASRGIRAAGFRVLVRTKCPALLLEMGFLSNRYDARLLASKSYQRAVARAAADAVTAYLTK